jgi:putative membrane protein
MCLGVSGGFEVIEALAGALSGQAGDAYLGTQGDQLDAQWDMVCALCGTVTLQLLLNRVHNRQVASTGRRFDEDVRVGDSG